MTKPQESLWDAVDRIRDTDPRFRREAYGFVMLALGIAAEALPPERRADPVRRHLTALELLQGMVTLAQREFGPMAPTVFREWGIHTSADVGELVFQLVENQHLSARPEDRREDFHGPDLMKWLAGSGPRVPGASGSSA